MKVKNVRNAIFPPERAVKIHFKPLKFIDNHHELIDSFKLKKSISIRELGDNNECQHIKRGVKQRCVYYQTFALFFVCQKCIVQCQISFVLLTSDL